VLDFGTGTGIWAMDFADEFPMALVTGTDLSPIQPEWVPPNVKFYVDDVESDWIEANTGDNRYDFIHGRSMGGSIKDWAKLYRQAFQSLKPGGWLEVQEYETWLQSDDDPDLGRAPYIKQFQEELNKASRVFGKELNVASQQKRHFIDTGFVDVHDDIYKVGHLHTLSLLTLIGDLRVFV
jgi:trans-aconitate methyltransferase